MSTGSLITSDSIIARVRSSPFVQILILVVVIASCTRFISGRNYKADLSSSENPRKIAIIPYWIPYLGHVPSLMFGPSRFLQRCSHQAANGIFSLNLFGVQHYIVTKSSLISALFEDSSAALSSDAVRWSLLVNVFGANKRLKEDYMRACSDAQTCLVNGLLLEPGLTELTRKTILGIQEHTPNLVSFSESIIDQSQWERAADADLAPSIDRSPSRAASSAVEINLFALIRNFTGNIALSSLLGNEFLDVYPKALADLWDLDGGFNHLTLGLPRWFPSPNLAKAHIARRNLLEGMASFQDAMDSVAAGTGPRQPWLELGDIGPIMRERNSTWRAYGTPSKVKAPFDLSLLWAMSAKSSTLVFWMLTHIWAVPGLVEKVRDEIDLVAKATQPPQIFSIPEPARLDMDIGGLAQSCPLLGACFYECIRLHSAATPVRSVIKTCEIHDTHEGAFPRTHPGSYVLKAGNFVAVPSWTRHNDSRCFNQSNPFQPSRFLEPDADFRKESTVNKGIFKPWGMGASTCPGRAYVGKEVLAFVAGILALWDFEPADSEHWTVPKQKEQSIVHVPCADLRVRISPRQLRQR